MATLLDAGLPLLKCLTLLAKQEENSFFKKTLEQLILSLQSGSSFSEALAEHPRAFDQLTRAMIQTGEETGMLGIVFHRLALFEEKREKNYRKMLSTAMYPCIVLSITLVIITLLLVFVIPKFETVFTEILHGQALPASTDLLLKASHFVTNHGIEALASVTFLFFFGKISGHFLQKNSFLHRLIFQIPFFGTLLQKNELARLLGTLGTLLENGVPILSAMHITKQITLNKAMHMALIQITQALQEGDSMTLPMRANSLFPSMVVSMITVGEETGQLPAMLLKTAALYEEEVDYSIAQCIALSEPLMIFILALLIGSIVIALFLPLVSMLSEMQ
jgi:type IV pilus assembly protein PilC